MLIENCLSYRLH